MTPIAIADLAKLVEKSMYLTVLTGAGISVESGISAYRGAASATWTQYNKHEVATEAAFLANPAKVWAWSMARREAMLAAEPNAGHYALAQLEQNFTRRGKTFRLITQNIDGLHHRAGSQAMIEVHGSVQRIKCFKNNHIETHFSAAPEHQPHCQQCDSLMRPDVVWFHENLSPVIWNQVVSAAQGCDLFLCIGTSSSVTPVSMLPLIARGAKAQVFELNPEETELSSKMTGVLRGPAARLLSELVAQS